MIELKVSQGAKPGHGGILPAEKNTPEIAKMRQVEPYTSVFSPGFHSVFSGVEGLVDFIKLLDISLVGNQLVLNYALVIRQSLTIYAQR